MSSNQMPNRRVRSKRYANMRFELVLVAGILCFCCWCAYVMLKINPSSSSSGQQGEANPSSSSHHHHNHQQQQQANQQLQQQQATSHHLSQNHQMQLQLQQQQQQARFPGYSQNPRLLPMAPKEAQAVYQPASTIVAPMVYSATSQHQNPYQQFQHSPPLATPWAIQPNQSREHRDASGSMMRPQYQDLQPGQQPRWPPTSTANFYPPQSLQQQQQQPPNQPQLYGRAPLTAHASPWVVKQASASPRLAPPNRTQAYTQAVWNPRATRSRHQEPVPEPEGDDVVGNEALHTEPVDGSSMNYDYDDGQASSGHSPEASNGEAADESNEQPEEQQNQRYEANDINTNNNGQQDEQQQPDQDYPSQDRGQDHPYLERRSSSFSEVDEQSSERDANGKAIRSKRQHYVNGKKVAQPSANFASHKSLRATLKASELGDNARGSHSLPAAAIVSAAATAIEPSKANAKAKVQTGSGSGFSGTKKPVAGDRFVADDYSTSTIVVDQSGPVRNGLGKGLGGAQLPNNVATVQGRKNNSLMMMMIPDGVRKQQQSSPRDSRDEANSSQPRPSRSGHGKTPSSITNTEHQDRGPNDSDQDQDGGEDVQLAGLAVASELPEANLDDELPASAKNEQSHDLREKLAAQNWQDGDSRSTPEASPGDPNDSTGTGSGSATSGSASDELELDDLDAMMNSNEFMFKEDGNNNNNINKVSGVSQLMEPSKGGRRKRQVDINQFGYQQTTMVPDGGGGAGGANDTLMNTNTMLGYRSEQPMLANQAETISAHVNYTRAPDQGHLVMLQPPQPLSSMRPNESDYVAVAFPPPDSGSYGEPLPVPTGASTGVAGYSGATNELMQAVAEPQPPPPPPQYPANFYPDGDQQAPPAPSPEWAPPGIEEPPEVGETPGQGSFDGQPDRGQAEAQAGYTIGVTTTGNEAPSASKVSSKHAKQSKMGVKKKSKAFNAKKKQKKHKKVVKVEEAKQHSSKAKKSKMKEGGVNKKKHKEDKKYAKNHKEFHGSTKGSKGKKGQGHRGAKKGALFYKDKGFKRKGFKKEYQKVEKGDHKTYFDEFRDKDHKKKWKDFKDKHHFSQSKKWAGMDKKKFDKEHLDHHKDKKLKHGKWEEKNKSKYSKSSNQKFKGSKSKSSKKKKKKKKKSKAEMEMKKKKKYKDNGHY